jgi:hypothetical protein
LRYHAILAAPHFTVHLGTCSPPHPGTRSADGISPSMVTALTVIHMGAAVWSAGVLRAAWQLGGRQLKASLGQAGALARPLALVGAIAAWFAFIFCTHSLVPTERGEYMVCAAECVGDEGGGLGRSAAPRGTRHSAHTL